MVEELHRANPVGRFSGLASDYAAHRPVYPDEAIDFVVARADLGPLALIVDIGAGTGISSRLFARRGLQVVGIEPNDEMRAQADSPHVEAVERIVFAHRQQLDRTGLLGRAFSVSYAPREPSAVEAFTATLDAVFDRFQQNGFVTLHYHTTVHLARRRA